MIRPSVTAVILFAATLAPVASYAFPVNGAGNTPATAPVKAKMVKLTLKNTSSAPMELTINDKTMTLAANSSSTISAPAGSQVLGTDKSVKIVISDEMAGGTVSFR